MKAQVDTQQSVPPPRDRICDLVLGILADPRARRPLPMDVPLRELGMSSIKMVNLMLAVEAAFDITIPESEITPENFVSIAAVENLVLRLIGARRVA
jgi:acyl carrier protein